MRSTATCTQHDVVPSQVGPTYGRKMMKGLLSSVYVHVSENQVGKSLCRVNPGHQDARRTAIPCQTNPVPYHADCFGHTLHIDENEKMVMFGVTHMCSEWLRWDDCRVCYHANQEEH